MVRAGVVLSILAALAWIGSTAAAIQWGSQDDLVLVLVDLALAFVFMFMVIWATIGMFSAIRQYLRDARRRRRTNFAKPS